MPQKELTPAACQWQRRYRGVPGKVSAVMPLHQAPHQRFSE